MQEFAFLILLMAAAVIAAYFYTKRRRSTIDASSRVESRDDSAS